MKLHKLKVSELPFLHRRYFLFQEALCGRLVYYDEIEEDFKPDERRIELLKGLSAAEGVRKNQPKKKKKKKKKKKRNRGKWACA